MTQDLNPLHCVLDRCSTYKCMQWTESHTCMQCKAKVLMKRQIQIYVYAYMYHTYNNLHPSYQNSYW